MPPKKRLWLDKEKCLFPGPNHPARITRRSRSVFRYDGRLICRRRIISWCRKSAFSATSSDLPLVRSASVSSSKRGRWWFDPTQNKFLKCVQAETYTLFHEDEQTKHELNLSFVKIGACPENTSSMDLIDCTRISLALAKKHAPLGTIDRFSERMSQVASTGFPPPGPSDNDSLCPSLPSCALCHR